jgi:amidase
LHDAIVPDAPAGESGEKVLCSQTAFLPFGLQIIGKRWSDERLPGIAEIVPQLTGGFRQPPGC